MKESSAKTPLDIPELPEIKKDKKVNKGKVQVMTRTTDGEDNVFIREKIVRLIPDDIDPVKLTEEYYSNKADNIRCVIKEHLVFSRFRFDDLGRPMITTKEEEDEYATRYGYLHFRGYRIKAEEMD